MPRLSRIAIYPIKSLDPVWVNQVHVLPSGALQDDRRWAMVREDGEVVNGKKEPLVHQIRLTNYESGSLTIQTPTAELQAHLETETAKLEQFLSSFFGYTIKLQENRAAGFPDDTDFPGPTLLGAASVREVGSWYSSLLTDEGGADAEGFSDAELWLRFRANLEIEDTAPFWEDRLYGAEDQVLFKIGAVLFEGANPCARCVVPSRNPYSGETVKGFAKTFMAKRQETLPEWAEKERFDHFYRLSVNTVLSKDDVNNDSERVIKVGDELFLAGVESEPSNE